MNSRRIRFTLPTASLAPLLALALTGCGAGPLRSPAAPIAAPAGDAIPAHASFVVDSRALGEARTIHVHLPAAYAATSAAFPLLVMPDGGLDEDFPHVVAAVEALAARGAIRPPIVVGIPNTQRRRDLTGPTQFEADRAIAPKVGGSAAFRAFVRDELLPEVARRWRVTGERTLIGESLAGLFVVETFLEEPALFAHAIALDPSLWWNGGALVAAADAKLAALDTAPRSLFLASSSVAEIAEPTARLAAAIGRAARPRLRLRHERHPELEHATIFRGLELSALEDALR